MIAFPSLLLLAAHTHNHIAHIHIIIMQCNVLLRTIYIEFCGYTSGTLAGSKSVSFIRMVLGNGKQSVKKTEIWVFSLGSSEHSAPIHIKMMYF